MEWERERCMIMQLDCHFLCIMYQTLKTSRILKDTIHLWRLLTWNKCGRCASTPFHFTKMKLKYQDTGGGILSGDIIWSQSREQEIFWLVRLSIEPLAASQRYIIHELHESYIIHVTFMSKDMDGLQVI